MSINRRNFLKGVGVGATVLGSSSLLADTTDKELKPILTASNVGAFYGHVDKNGKLVKITPHESAKHDYPGVEAWIDRVYSETRVKYPYVRKSYLEGKNAPELRGKEEFVRVSWEKAMELIVDKLSNTPYQNVFNASYGGWGHPGLLHNCNAVAGRFLNTTFGGAVGTDGEYSNGAAGKVNTSIIGDLEVYSLQTTHEQILANTKVYVLWGADLYKCNLIDFKVANRANMETYKNMLKVALNLS